jgi:uncharacterized membrane protein
MNDAKRYWFPAKRYGWGWGLPCSWQGWFVLLAFLITVFWACIDLLPRAPVRFWVVIFGTVVAFLLICVMKGEPPSWRRGNDK